MRLHPRHGVHAPTSVVPPLGPDVARRVSALAQYRRDGSTGPVTVVGTAADAVGSQPRGSVRLDATIDYLDARTITALHSDPPAGLAPLVGTQLGRRFRARVAEALPGEVASRSPLALLLDDLPVATLVGGYAVQAAGVLARPPASAFAGNADLCAGWALDATIWDEVNRSGLPPVVTGPIVSVPAFAGPVELEPHAMLRSRRTDVRRDGDALVVDTFFRDQHRSGDGVDTALHEYSLSARIDAATLTVLACSVIPGALPWVECSAAVASAGEVVGHRVGELPGFVRTTFTGVTTCTHLNDQLRDLSDVAALARLLP